MIWHGLIPYVLLLFLLQTMHLCSICLLASVILLIISFCKKGSLLLFVFLHLPTLLLKHEKTDIFHI